MGVFKDYLITARLFEHHFVSGSWGEQALHTFHNHYAFGVALDIIADFVEVLA